MSRTVFRLILLFATWVCRYAWADSITVAETWKDNTVRGFYSSSTDVGTFSASLTVPGLSNLTANDWSNLLVTVNSSSLNTGTFSDTMANAPSYGGTVSATNATFYFQLTDTNGNLVNAYKMTFFRSGNTFAIAGLTANPASVSYPPWSILAINYLDSSGLATFSIHDQASCEVLLQDAATTYATYADIQKILYITGTNTITYDSQGTELNSVRVSGAADYAPPTLTAVSPTGALTTTNDLLTVQVKATDSIGVSNVEFYVNGLDYGSGVAGTANLWSLNFALPPGTSTVQTLATDESGNLSTTNRLTVTYVNAQTNASLITVTEHWLDGSQTDSAGDVFGVSQDVGTLNAALLVPGLRSLSATTWSNLVLTVSFGDLAFSNRLTEADVLTTNRAVFYLNTILDPNSNLLTDVQLSLARTGNTVVLACQTGDPTYDFNHPLVADFYLGLNGPVQDARPFALTLQDGSTFSSYADVSQLVYISGSAAVTYDSQSNELDNVRITGAADFVPPACAIIAPTANQPWSNALFAVTGTAKDNVAVSNVFYALNGGAWFNAVSTNRWTNWTAQVALAPGTNNLQAWAVDTSGNNSLTNSVNFVYILSGQLQLRALGLGSFTPNYSNAWLQLGQNYSITSAPARGFTFAGWITSTNWLGGMASNNPVLRFTMASNLTLLATFTETNRPNLTLTAPAAGQKLTNALATLSGTAIDNWQVVGVWCQVNSNAWTLASTTNGYTNWTQTVTLLAGTNILKAYAQDLGGNFSLTNLLSVVSSNTFKLQLVLTNGPLTASGLNLNLQISPGLNGHVQVSTNLLNWTTLTNFVGTNTSLTVHDASATNAVGRFYRAVIP